MKGFCAVCFDKIFNPGDFEEVLGDLALIMFTLGSRVVSGVQ